MEMPPKRGGIFLPPVQSRMIAQCITASKMKGKTMQYFTTEENETREQPILFVDKGDDHDRGVELLCVGEAA
jgi:hypothetical protein